MFYSRGILESSSLMDGGAVRHGFSARAGGVSDLPHTATLNLTRDLGDSDEVVKKNIEIFASSLTGGTLGGESVVTAHQIHSARVRYVTYDNAGEGFSRAMGEDCDGFVTDVPGVMPIIRVADCVPILLRGEKPDGSPVVAAVHAGWRGTVASIAGEAVRIMLSLGCGLDSVRAAIGAHIGRCCFEVGDDFYDAVRDARGSDFAVRHISSDSGSLHADLTGMNVEILLSSGVSEGMIDVSPDCTMCDPVKYYSHRATGGRRGTMGAGIVFFDHARATAV